MLHEMLSISFSLQIHHMLVWLLWRRASWMNGSKMKHTPFKPGNYRLTKMSLPRTKSLSPFFQCCHSYNTSSLGNGYICSILYKGITGIVLNGAADWLRSQCGVCSRGFLEQWERKINPPHVVAYFGVGCGLSRHHNCIPTTPAQEFGLLPALGAHDLADPLPRSSSPLSLCPTQP